MRKYLHHGPLLTPAYPALACVWEATARKVGNVHPTACFDNTDYVHFLTSALVLGETRLTPETRVGQAILTAVVGTKEAVGLNTNLGIILLLIPLMKAGDVPDFRRAVGRVLGELNVADARDAFEAICLASPGGLGDAPEQDVREEPTVTLLEAMALAADRDLIARQYANGYADVFDFGVPAFADALERFGCVEAAVIDCQFRWLAEFPDSLIARKNGPAVAADVRTRAGDIVKLGGIATPEGRAAAVVFDKHLRGPGNKLNPGTTADLVTACLYAALRENKVAPSAPFRWGAPDWL